MHLTSGSNEHEIVQEVGVKLHPKNVVGLLFIVKASLLDMFQWRDSETASAKSLQKKINQLENPFLGQFSFSNQT